MIKLKIGDYIHIEDIPDTDTWKKCIDAFVKAGGVHYEGYGEECKFVYEGDWYEWNYLGIAKDGDIYHWDETHNYSGYRRSLQDLLSTLEDDSSSRDNDVSPTVENVSKSNTEAFKVGDKVIITECITCHGFKIGEIVTLTNINEGYAGATNDRIEYGLSFSEFEAIKVNSFEVNSNGGVKDTQGKLRWTLLPLEALKEVVKVLEYGANKYKEKNNWQKVEVERYHEALWRHWTAYQSGEKIDPETGLSHIAHLLCDGLFILWNDLKNDKK